MHIVVLPLPLQGHVNICLAIAKMLVSQGCSFTFVLTQDLAGNVAQHQGIHFATVASHGSCFADSFDHSSCLSIMKSIRPGFEELLQKLLLSSEAGVSCIMADSYVTWSREVAAQFGVPRYVLYVSNAHTLAIALHVPSLVSQGLVHGGDPGILIDCIPGVLPLRARDLPQSVRLMPEFNKEMVKDMHKAAGAIFNTVEGWESNPLKTIKETLPVYPVGPSLLAPGFVESPSKEKPGVWAEDRSCLAWLDTLPPSSVLYVSFGSLATMSIDQMRELAEGLEASGQPFLWVVRSNIANSSVDDVLPQDFGERTRDRGLIIRWAPQLEVLAHAAVGGFLTHCGWNSIVENLCKACVPMLCWPHLGEQRLNARLLVDEWKAGIELVQDDDGWVKKEAVAKAVKELMRGEVGECLRDNALRLKETACLAWQEGGSSCRYLQSLIQDIKNLSTGVKAID
ncbi:hypothetical protein GOP47_0003120 [Adiantum capillus-veneris]|uniref:Glycosyltransferase n=1 Tax=Adiantum capillus-veneris TaxID=13818 RepID=A0A9D4ZRY6_ADICA|nr:hypothetical protein GOP47_0003120 [Adiantum capillus-veneris]